MRHPINIAVLNDTVGVPVSSDGVMGLFMKAVAIPGTFDFGTAYLLSKIEDLLPLGVTAAYDTSNNTAVYFQVQRFYAKAGAGALLWLFAVDSTTSFASFVASDLFKSFIRFTAQADFNNRVKMIAFGYDLPLATQNNTDFPADVIATLTAMKAVQLSLFNEGSQFSYIVDGYNMRSNANIAALATMADKACYSGSLCITGTKPNGVSDVGGALGRFARISIGHGFGAVEDGSQSDEAYLTSCVQISPSGTLTVGKTYTVYGAPVLYNGLSYNVKQSFVAVVGFTVFTTLAGGTVVESLKSIDVLSPSDIDSLGLKQFLFYRKWNARSGYFWNDGATCEDPAKQLSTQEYNRVANYLSAAALSFFIDQIGKNLPVDVKTGSVESTYLNAKQTQFYNQYIQPLNQNSGNTGDLSGGSLLLFAPNFNSTKTMNFKIFIVPTPILGTVSGTIQFSQII